MEIILQNTILPRNKITCELGKEVLKSKTKKDNNCSFHFNACSGSHVLRIIKHAWYENVISYINVVNPMFYLYQLKFFGNDSITGDTSFLSANIEFDVLDEKQAYIVLNVKRAENRNFQGISYCVFVEEYSGINNIRISYSQLPPNISRRFKLIRMFSALFWAFVFILLSIVNIVCYNDNVVETSVFALFVMLFSLGMIYNCFKKEL